MLNSTSEIVKKGVTVAAPLGAIGGFVADVLSPLAPFSEILFYISLGLLVMTAMLLIAQKRPRAHFLISLFSFFVISTPILFGCFILNKKSDDPKGYWGSHVAFIGNIQETLFDIKKDVEEIKKTTEVIDKKTDIVLQKVEDIAKGFEELSSNAGIISNPTTPQEYYHNARFYELESNFSEAAKQYQKYLQFNLEFVDPHLNYQMILKISEGSEATKEIYNYLIQNSPNNIALKLARHLLDSAAIKLAALKELANQNPNYAPVFYILSNEYSQKTLGEQTLEDKRMEKQYLETFIKLNADGNFLKYFLDKKIATQWIEDANQRMQVLSNINSAVFETPITFSSKYDWIEGWFIRFQIADIKHVEEVFYKLNIDNDYKSMGFSDETNPETQKKYPNLEIGPLRIKDPQYTISIKYRDTNSIEHGPYELPFVTSEEKIKYVNSIFDKSEWMQINGTERPLVFISNLIVYRDIIKDVHYSLDNESLDKTIPFEELRQNNNSNTLYIPKGTQYIVMQISFINDTKSAIKRFNAPK